MNGQGFCCNDGTPEAAQARVRTRAASGNFKPNDDYEKMQFYYHPDHLGSSSYITNLDGEVAQHIEYVPFGEVFIEERNNTWNTPYLFNAKEFDEETGMYYYGARYYDPRLSLWMSTDSEEEKFFNISTYTYCNNNPIILTDPDGNSPTIITGLIGAGIGGIVGGGIETVSQLIKQGKISDWKAVGGSALQGFITGGAAGLTGGASLLATAATAGTANVVGGVVNRTIQGQRTTLGNVVSDATVGAVFGAGGKLIGTGLRSLFSSISKRATSKLTTLASQAIAKIGSGKGSVYGTKVHAAFSKLAAGLKIGGYEIRTEVSYLNGRIVKYGTKGSARIDAGLYNSKGELVQVFDLKTGGARLTSKQVQHIQAQTRKNVPVTEIRGN